MSHNHDKEMKSLDVEIAHLHRLHGKRQQLLGCMKSNRNLASQATVQFNLL